jgi:hypothetical protein
MGPQQIFSIANLAALCGWALLIFLPNRRWASTVAGAAIPGLLAATYAMLIAANFWGAEGGFSSLEAVERLFGNSWLLLAGWLHYLAFDLLIGAWEVRDARTGDVPTGRSSPVSSSRSCLDQRVGCSMQA